MYTVIFESFAQSHYMKGFARKYKGAWDSTERAIVKELEGIELLIPTKKIVTPITDLGANVVICKTEFKIAGTQESRHGSGNRCIVAMHRKELVVRVLLVYAKTDLSGHDETAEWKAMIKENYSKYCEFLG